MYCIELMQDDEKSLYRIQFHIQLISIRKMSNGSNEYNEYAYGDIFSLEYM